MDRKVQVDRSLVIGKWFKRTKGRSEGEDEEISRKETCHVLEPNNLNEYKHYVP